MDRFPLTSTRVGAKAQPVAERMRVRGTVQGVGFRPAVWRIAHELGVRGAVCNDAEGVLIEAVGAPALLDAFARRLRSAPAGLARIDSLCREPAALPSPLPDAFLIAESRGGRPLTALAADAAICPACVAELLDPSARRYRYPLVNCTCCGPRLSFVTGLPYDRPRTTMSGFAMCAACRAEYENPADRRFHAQPIACHACGPQTTLLRLDGKPFVDAGSALDACDAAGALLARGHIVAVKGLGGYQLACDATDAAAVERLRAAKRRERKPFALMAADADAVAGYCVVGDDERALLQSPAAPIVLLERRRGGPARPALAAAVAPGLRTLGFMLPGTGLHHLLLRRMPRPIVLTSGNLSDEPQAIALDELRERFGASAAVDFVLDHQRPIARRLDDSVARVLDGAPRLLRRARGFAPAPLALPPGFERAPPVLAYGGELKNTLCLLRDGAALLSAHVGDLDDAATRADWLRALADLVAFYDFDPALRACDRHPDYASSRRAHDDAARGGTTAVEVQHHHAHIAACLADNGWPLDGRPVIGVALDGLGWGDDGTLWGGEFAVCDYRRFERRGTFKPVALPGGDQAAVEPWRNTYAHLMAGLKWPALATDHRGLELVDFLAAKPRALLDSMIARGVNSPPASSCGRLFDAVAAALGICREHAAYEGQGAVELEAIVDAALLEREGDRLGYPFAIPQLRGSGLPYLEPLPMWQALLGDLQRRTPPAVIAARFHAGLAQAIVALVAQIAEREALDSVALSGGVWQNRVLFERVARLLRGRGFAVLAHARVPCNDGGLALGQAVVAAARALG